MNKQDKILIAVILITAVSLLVVFNFNTSFGTQASVYYENDLVLKIDLNKDNEYDVKGENGNVHIVVKDGKIKVDEEISPLHLCSKQGFIKSDNESIVCLPNKIVIKIDNDLDTVVG